MTQVATQPATKRPEEAGYITLKRVSDNPQKKRFGDTVLNSLHYRDDLGKLQRATFIDGTGKERPLTIGSGGTIQLFNDRYPDNHNIQSVRKLIAAKPSPLGTHIKLELIDHAESAKKNNDLRKARLATMRRIEERQDEEDFIESLARRLGVGSDVGSLTFQEVLDFVLTRAESDPDRVNNILDDGNQVDLFVIDKAKDPAYGLLQLREGYYYFQDRLLGKTDTEILVQLRRDDDVFNQIKMLVNVKANRSNVVRTKIDESQMNFEELNTGRGQSEEEFDPTKTQPSSPTEIGELIDKWKETDIINGDNSQSKLVSFAQGKGWMFGPTMIGKTKVEAAEFLYANHAIRNQIQKLYHDYNKSAVAATVV